MHAVTNADREAAEELRVLLADASGFWHTHGDTGPICMALARHRELAERRLLEKMDQLTPRPAVVSLVPPTRDAAAGVRDPKVRQGGRAIALDRRATATG